MKTKFGRVKERRSMKKAKGSQFSRGNWITDATDSDKAGGIERQNEQIGLLTSLKRSSAGLHVEGHVAGSHRHHSAGRRPC